MIAKEKLVELGFFCLGGLLGLLTLLGLFYQVSTKRIMAKVKVAGVPVAHLLKPEAEKKLATRVREYKLMVRLSESSLLVPSEVFAWDVAGTVDAAMDWPQSLSFSRVIEGIFVGVDLPVQVTLKPTPYEAWEQKIEEMVAIPGKSAAMAIKRGIINLENGEDSIHIDKARLEEELLGRAETLSAQELEVPILYKRLALTKTESDEILALAKVLQSKTLEIGIQEMTVRLSGDELVSFVSLEPESAKKIDQNVVHEYVEGLATRYDHKSQDAKLVFEGGLVKEFAPHKDGLEIDKVESTRVISDAVERLAGGNEIKEKVEVAAKITLPEVTLANVNNLGINQLLGRGESYYAHSIANRVYNVGLASSRVSGVIVAPGVEFSFNKTVGEISAGTGYRTAYVIQNGRTELGDGGGVCQVSTTLFRAVMNAGLPITERWAHAYRVGYYEQNSKPGFDATIFSPSKDFKFVNDTPGHILVQVTNDPKNYHLVFEIYGSSDGRVVAVSEARVSGISPPPPDLYQDDPTLPAGQVKQVDWAAWGAKSVFDYKVERGGETIFAKTFTSNYRPWANVYLRGTGQ